MEWNVKNALNRDVERQHLNKILKEIKGGQDEVIRKVDAANSGLGAIQNNLSNTIVRIINNTIPPSSLATSVTLTGDVTGVSVQNGSDNAVTIETTLTGNYLEDAPVDAFAYWRRYGQWERVTPAVDLLNQIQGQGFTVYDDVNEAWYTRSILAVDDTRIVITDGDGLAADPTIDLAEVVPEDGGTLQLTRFDAYGRRDAEGSATTDDLAEGVDNLYYTDERVDDRIDLQKGEPNGIAPLGPDGLVPTEFLPPLSTPAHNSLTGLQGGAPGEYYHLSKEDYDNRILPYVYLTDEAGNQLTDEAGNFLIVDGPTISWSSLYGVPVESFQTLPAMTLAAANALVGVADGRMVLITDLTGGREPCWYDTSVSSGTKWRRFSDRSMAN